MEQRQMLGDRYELHDPIGRGGMATIFRANDTRMERMVAVKILREMYSSDPKFVLRFQREARAVSALSHPNIVQVFDYGRNNDEYYIVMELIEGTDLRRYLKTNGILDLRRAVVIAHDVALALGAAHQRGIVHRDVKPQNILVNDQALVKLTDFGIATFYRDMDNERLTTTGMTLGTVQYYAPEQAQGEVVTPAADVYSLGVVMYEMLVGHPPFDGDTPVAIAVRHIQETPARPSRFNPQIPIALERIIMRCLEKDPRDRYRDGDALAYALETFDKPRTPSGRIEGVYPAGQPMGSAGAAYPNLRRNSGPRQGPPGFDEGGDYLPGAFNQNPTRADVIPGTMGRADVAPPPNEDDKPSPAVGVTTAIIVASVLLLLGVGCFLAFKLGIIGGSQTASTGQVVTIPKFVGLSYTYASQEAMKLGLTLNPTYIVSTATAGTITDQNPRADTQVTLPYNNTVSVSVSKGATNGKVQVPDVTNFTVSDACAKINSVTGLICNANYNIDTQPVPVNVLPGNVTRTNPPANSFVAPNTYINLYVAPTATATVGPTATTSATATATASATATATSSVTATATATSSATATASPTPNCTVGPGTAIPTGC